MMVDKISAFVSNNEKSKRKKVVDFSHFQLVIA